MGDTVLASASRAAKYSRSWQVWGVAKQELLYLCWALMEIALLTPIALIFMGWARFWPPGQVALWLLLLAAAALQPGTLSQCLADGPKISMAHRAGRFTADAAHHLACLTVQSPHFS